MGKGKDRRLVPNTSEQAALARGLALQAEGKSLREIATVWADEFGLPEIDAKSVNKSSIAGRPWSRWRRGYVSHSKTRRAATLGGPFHCQPASAPLRADGLDEVSSSQLPQRAIIIARQSPQAALMNWDNLQLGLWLIWMAVLAGIIVYVLIQ